LGERENKIKEISGEMDLGRKGEGKGVGD